MQRGDWVCVRIGPWTLHFKIETESRFPHVEDHVPDADSAVTTLYLSDTDAVFLSKSVKRLPCGDDCDLPVTVDLGCAKVGVFVKIAVSGFCEICFTA